MVVSSLSGIHSMCKTTPFLTGPIMAAPPPPPQTYTFSPAAAAHGNFYGNCY
ncbi:hypothetical protein F2Q70_00000286 [Brassica cretica]|nr:hypothetical protein F2Q68_00018757 [Brassica cretica]KAF2572284.1 hypothetical protein F2Q70_00000286 [Brassica cretica]KAF3561840.1 hypothetical protein DY000_02011118 [Brassica cretica]